MLWLPSAFKKPDLLSGMIENKKLKLHFPQEKNGDILPHLCLMFKHLLPFDAGWLLSDPQLCFIA